MSPVTVVAPHITVSTLQARLWTSDGTCGPADSAGWPPFEAEARLARGPWSLAADASSQALIEHVPRQAATTVCLTQLPSVLVQEIGALDQLSSASGQDPDADGQLSSIIERLRVALPDACGWTLRGDVVGAGFTKGLGGLSNTTLNKTTGRYVGMHLDSWDRLPPAKRHRGQNRVCLNLGAGPRSLQFVPLTAMEMCVRLDALAPADADRCTGRHGDLARRFLRCFPDEPVVRITILPGEAYIAPTENLVHDGWTVDTPGPDVTLSIRGHFEPLAEARRRRLHPAEDHRRGVTAERR